MSHSVVCWGCGKERRRNAPHPANPHDRTEPPGWKAVGIVAPERWWELRFLVCGNACEAIVDAAIAPLRAHVGMLHKRMAQTKPVTDAEFWED